MKGWIDEEVRVHAALEFRRNWARTATQVAKLREDGCRRCGRTEGLKEAQLFDKAFAVVGCDCNYQHIFEIGGPK